MAILANRVKIKNNLVELAKFIAFLVRKFFILLLLLSSCYLLYFSPPSFLTKNTLEIAGKFLSAGSFIYTETIETSLGFYNRLTYFQNLEDENLRLKLKLAELERIEQISSELESENIELKKILQIAPTIENNFVTAKVLGMSITPFSSSAIIGAGEKNNVKINDIVRGKLGLVGRISSVATNYSTVLLINDHDSRIPVITSDSKVRGILAKQGDRLKIIHLNEDHTAQNGEILYTSGDGKIYPKGIAVAIIDEITSDGGAFVKTMEDFNKITFLIIESRPN